VSALRLKTFRACDKLIISTRGDLDLASAPVLDGYLTRLAELGHRHLVINLRRTGYIDSSGLAVLMRVHRTLRATGGQLSLVGCQPSVGRVLRLVGFHHLFVIDEYQPSRLRRAQIAA